MVHVKKNLHNNLFIQLHLHICIINLIILYIHILCRKYKEENQSWMQCRPQKHRHHDLIGGDSFPKFEEWIANAVDDAKEEGQDITMEESELSQSPHLWGMCFSGIWA